MTVIYAATEDQALIATVLPRLSQSNINSVRLHVAFDSSWDAYPAKSAVFTTSESVRPYQVAMSVEGDCLIPAEVLAEECKLYIVVEGANSSTGATKASTRLTIKVQGGHPAVVISDPAPSVYKQLLTENAMLRSRMSELEAAGTVEGSEVIGIRTGADGKTYATAGDAVRAQITSRVSNQPQPDRMVSGAYINVTGSVVSNAAYSYISVSVIPGSTIAYQYAVDSDVLRLAFYDIDGVMIETHPCTEAIQYINVPATAYTLKATYKDESYLALVHDVGDITAAIDAVRRTGVDNSNVQITHRLAKELIPGAYIRVSDGNIAPHSVYKYLEMPAIPCATILYSFTSDQSVAGLAFYDASDSFIDGVIARKGTQEILVPENAVTIRATATTIDDVVLAGTAHEIAQGIRTNAQRIASLATKFSTPSIHLPSSSRAIVGREWNLHFENVILCDDLELYDIRCSVTPTLTDWNNFGEFLRITPTTSGTYTITLSVCDKYTNEPVCTKSFALDVINDSAVTGKKVLFIGDSLTETAYYPAEIQHNLSKGGMVSLGTRTATMNINGKVLAVNHEGRGGWSTSDYINKSEDNAFYNPATKAFDFEYYMSSQGYEGVDVVSIFLGTNNITNTNNANNIKLMIESIHRYDANIVVLVNLVNMPATQTGYGYRQFGTTAHEFKCAVFKLNDQYIENFDGVMDNVFVSEVYFNLDPKRDYGTTEIPASARRPNAKITVQTNNVHPDSIGYLKFADVIYSNLLYHLQK